MRTHRIHLPLLAACALLLGGCNEAETGPLAPDVEVQAAKGGNAKTTGGGSSGIVLVAEIVPHADAFVSIDPQLASTCPGETASNAAVLFRHSGCLIVQPTGSDYALTDDLTFEAKTRKGTILSMRLTGQDVIGDDGIMHETDFWSYDPPVTIDPAGYTIHVHLDQVPVYRLSGHLRGGRVGTIGTIAIGDIVYRPAQ